MFTGIIEQTGKVKSVFLKKDTYRLEILPTRNMDSLKNGDSLSINGTCLTLVGIKNGVLFFDVMKETFKRTSLRFLKKNDIINIERALSWKSRVDGHFVYGHIDSVCKIKSIKKTSRPCIDISIPKDSRAYVVERGSIAIEGISLTVGELYKNGLRAYIIPYTLLNTNLKYKKINDPVNVEFDILGKYAQNRQVLGKTRKPSRVEESLKKAGFI